MSEPSGTEQLHPRNRPVWERHRFKSLHSGAGGKSLILNRGTSGDNDLLHIAHAGASALGSGYGHVFHIFLPKGVDVCFTGTSELLT